MKCRHCGSDTRQTFLDLGHAPPSNAYLEEEDLKRPEIYLPLITKVCEQCWLVQTDDYADARQLFAPDYAYFSSTSSSWLAHAEHFAKKMINELSLDSQSYVIEVASNDGYLLKNFVSAGIPCLGIEPTEGTAAVAERHCIPVLREFFGESLGRSLADSGRQADLIVGNNVYAHVPDINDFTRALKVVLKPTGIITLEFPHLMRLIAGAQFDTIYHEHFSYLSLYTVNKIFLAAGLRIWRVEELSTHGGSLRVFGCHFDDRRATEPSVNLALQAELLYGMQHLEIYKNFQCVAERIKCDLIAFLIEQKRLGKKVAAYGAAAKGNTLLNFAGVRSDLIEYVCDASPAKQGKYMPGSHIPIKSPTYMSKNPPDWLLIIPWNIVSEIVDQNSFLRRNGVRFLTAVPELRML
jgi:hypothetical protein